MSPSTMLRSIRIVLVLAALIGVSASILPRKPVLLSPRLNKQLSVRGGAGPLDPALVAKVATGVLLAQGTVATLAPEPSIVSYGYEPTPAGILAMRRVGVAILDVGIMAFGLLYKDWSVNTAAGVSAFIWAAEILGSTLNDEATTIGFSNINMMVWLAIHFATAYVYLTDGSSAPTVMKAMSLFTIGTCLPLMFFPSVGFQSYGFDLAKIIDSDLAVFKSVGACLAAIGVFVGSVACGVSPSKALGYAFVPSTLLNIIMLFITKEGEKFGAPKGPSYFWLIFEAIVIGTLAVD